MQRTRRKANRERYERRGILSHVSNPFKRSVVKYKKEWCSRVVDDGCIVLEDMNDFFGMMSWRIWFWSREAEGHRGWNEIGTCIRNNTKENQKPTSFYYCLFKNNKKYQLKIKFKIQISYIFHNKKAKNIHSEGTKMQ